MEVFIMAKRIYPIITISREFRRRQDTVSEKCSQNVSAFLIMTRIL